MIVLLTMLALQSAGTLTTKGIRNALQAQAHSAADNALVRGETFALAFAQDHGDFDLLLDADADCIADGAPAYPLSTRETFHNATWQRVSSDGSAYLTRFVDDHDDALTGTGYAALTQSSCQEGNADLDQPARDRNRTVILQVVGLAPDVKASDATVVVMKQLVLSAAQRRETFVQVHGDMNGALEACAHSDVVVAGSGPLDGYGNGAALVVPDPTVVTQSARLQPCDVKSGAPRVLSAPVTAVPASVQVQVHDASQCAFYLTDGHAGDKAAGAYMWGCAPTPAAQSLSDAACWFPLLSAAAPAITADDSRVASCRSVALHTDSDELPTQGCVNCTQTALQFNPTKNAFTFGPGGVAGVYFVNMMQAQVAVVGSADGTDDIALGDNWLPITLVAKKDLQLSVLSGRARLGVGTSQQFASVVVGGSLQITGALSVAGNLLVRGGITAPDDTRSYGHVQVEKDLTVAGRWFARYPDPLPLEPTAQVLLPHVIVTADPAQLH